MVKLYFIKYILAPILSLLLLSLLSCQQDSNRIGDISYEEGRDNPNFKICNSENEAKQYFNNSSGPNYFGSKQELLKLFEKFKPTDNLTKGWLRVRFIINCEGTAGRFRTISANENYESIKFDTLIVSQVIGLVRKFDKWAIMTIEGEDKDYYQYLTFKFFNGEIEEILP